MNNLVADERDLENNGTKFGNLHPKKKKKTFRVLEEGRGKSGSMVFYIELVAKLGKIPLKLNDLTEELQKMMKKKKRKKQRSKR